MNAELIKIINRHTGKIGELHAILQDIQRMFGYLSEQALKTVAEKTNRSMVDIYGFARSYDLFKFKPESDSFSKDQSLFPQPRESVLCPYCNHSLMDDSIAIDNAPSVKITCSFGFEEHGWLRLSSRPESLSISSEYKLPDEGEINFFCPHCHNEIVASETCRECGAPMLPVVQEGRFANRCLRVDRHKAIQLDGFLKRPYHEAISQEVKQ